MEVDCTIDQDHEILEEIQATVSKVHAEIFSIESITFLSLEAAIELEKIKRFLEVKKIVKIEHQFDF